MIIRIVEKHENNAITVISEKPFNPKKDENAFRIIDRFFDEYGEEIFGNKVVSHGISEIRTDIDHTSSWHLSAGGSEDKAGRHTEIIGSRTSVDEKLFWQAPLVLSDKDGKDVDTGRLIGVDIYEEGFVISTGKEGTNFMGMSFKAYIDKIGRRKISSTSKTRAKIFHDRKKLIDYLEKYTNVLKYCVSTYGYCVSVEPVCRFYEEKENAVAASLTEKKQQKLKAEKERIAELLHEINSVEQSGNTYEPADTTEEEAVNRMKRIGLDSDLVIKPFMKGKLFMSEGGGILYDLNKSAQIAVEEVKDLGGLPYHVVRTGPMYAVLYVSSYKDEWDGEQYDRKTEEIYASVYNEQFGMSEIGPIGVRPVSGGLRRTW